MLYTTSVAVGESPPLIGTPQTKGPDRVVVVVWASAVPRAVSSVNAVTTTKAKNRNGRPLDKLHLRPDSSRCRRVVENGSIDFTMLMSKGLLEIRRKVAEEKYGTPAARTRYSTEQRLCQEKSRKIGAVLPGLGIVGRGVSRW